MRPFSTGSESFVGLASKGWTERAIGGGNIELRSQDALVTCWFRQKKLYYVNANVIGLPGRAPTPITITLFGKTVTLPASETAIVEALGSPIKKRQL